MTEQTDIGIGVAHIADAIHHLRAAQESIEATLSSKAPGCPEEKTAIGLARVLAHLSQAAADVPDEFWAIMLARHNPETIDRVMRVA